MPLTSSNADFGALRPVKLQTIRDVIRPERYQRSTGIALAWYMFDAIFYLSAITGALLAGPWWLKLLFGLLAGSAVASMFVWAHDAAHGALFQSKRTAEILGTIFMLPSLNMYRLWAFGHNRVHHGFTSLSTIDWVWRPWTPQEYKGKTVWQKMIYRLERSPYTCALHYLLRIWWPGMVRFKVDVKSKDRWPFFYSKMITLVFFISFSALAYWISGPMGIIAAVIVPFLVFNYYIALFVFLHHTHPNVPFFAEKEEWSQSLGQLYCSTIVRCSKVSEYLIHNILIHTPHHVDPRIPFYRLKGAYEDLRAEYGQYIHETRFGFFEIRRIFKECKLYDYEGKSWLSFRSGRSWIEEKAADIAASATSSVYQPGKTAH